MFLGMDHHLSVIPQVAVRFSSQSRIEDLGRAVVSMTTALRHKSLLVIECDVDYLVLLNSVYLFLFFLCPM